MVLKIQFNQKITLKYGLKKKTYKIKVVQWYKRYN